MTSPVKRIEVIGAGAVGALYASKLFHMDRNCVGLIAAGERYDRLKDRGLIVNDKHIRPQVVRPDDRSPAPDLIIVAVKYNQLGRAIQDIKGRLGRGTLILSAMNGIDSEELIGDACGVERVLYGSAVETFSTRIEDRIHIVQEGRLFFGEADNTAPSDRVRAIQSVFEKAGIAYETPPDMIRTIWWKFMVNIGVNQVSAVVRCTNAVLQASQEARELMVSAMREVVALAQAAGVNLSEKDIENFTPFFMGLSPHGRTSMLQDVEAGRKTEVEMFAGKVAALGARYGIPTPVNETLFRIIRAIEAGFDLHSRSRK
jgi:2-dehydropantoate 2-reductase